MSDQFNSLVNNILDPLKSNQILSILMYVFLISYASMVAPVLSVEKAGPIFSNVYFKIAILSLIAWTGSHDPILSILVAVAYFMTLTYLSNQSLKQLQTGSLTTPAAEVLVTGQGQQFQQAVAVQTQQAAISATSATSGVLPLTNSTMNNATVTTTGEVLIKGAPTVQQAVVAAPASGAHTLASV